MKGGKKGKGGVDLSLGEEFFVAINTFLRGKC